MSKKWSDAPNRFRHLDRGWVKEFMDDQEKKLNADHNWRPNEEPNEPLGGTYAIPLESQDNTE